MSDITGPVPASPGQLQFRKATVVKLKNHPVYNEKWLQTQLAEDPTLLGLGDLVLKDVERRQPRAGRLDLLFTDPESQTRYEVEVQLGTTDEAHIIRTIEYWDIERARYPQYDHVAVIVAEDITSRFLNVIALFNRSIPLIAIQMQALQVGNLVTLSAATVLDNMPSGTEEEDEPGPAADRGYWLERASQESLSVVDAMLELANEVRPGMAPNYTKGYVGTSRNGVPDNFLYMTPRKAHHLVVGIRLAQDDELTARLEDAGIESLPYGRRGRYRLRLKPNDVKAHRDLLLEVIKKASGTPADDGEVE